MPRTRLPYPKEFRIKIIELARSGRSVVELASEFEPSAIGFNKPTLTLAIAMMG